MSERWTHVAQLGIRFMDHALDRPVTDGLIVTARPLTEGGRRTAAVRTGDGVYAFFHLPSLHDAEYGGTSPPREFLIEATDRYGRFLPAALGVTLPAEEDALQEVYLFSASARMFGAALASAGGRLWHRTRDAPAAHAVVEVEVDGAVWYGVADERGAVRTPFPYPTVTGGDEGAPLHGQTWPVTVRVRLAPDPLIPPPESPVPDLRAILAQPQGLIWQTEVDSAAEWSRTLQYGQELILSTDGLPDLLVDPSP